MEQSVSVSKQDEEQDGKPDEKPDGKQEEKQAVQRCCAGWSGAVTCRRECDTPLPRPDASQARNRCGVQTIVFPHSSLIHTSTNAARQQWCSRLSGGASVRPFPTSVSPVRSVALTFWSHAQILLCASTAWGQSVFHSQIATQKQSHDVQPRARVHSVKARRR